MVVKVKAIRRLLAYFLESQLWKNYKKNIAHNISYWEKEDIHRAESMRRAVNGKLGIKVEDYLHDILSCVYDSELKPRTKQRLYVEIEELEFFHEKLNSLKDSI